MLMPPWWCRSWYPPTMPNMPCRQAMFDEMTDEEKMYSGKLEDILDKAFLVTDLHGNVLLEKT